MPNGWWWCAGGANVRNQTTTTRVIVEGLPTRGYEDARGPSFCNDLADANIPSAEINWRVENLIS